MGRPKLLQLLSPNVHPRTEPLPRHIGDSAGPSHDVFRLVIVSELRQEEMRRARAFAFVCNLKLLNFSRMDAQVCPGLGLRIQTIDRMRFLMVKTKFVDLAG